jgi:hypothetical protein
MDQMIAGFLNQVREDQALWTCVDATVLALRLDGKWHNLHTRIRLHSRSVQTASKVTIGVNEELLRSYTVQIPPDRVGSILEAIAAGVWEVEEESIHYLENPRAAEPQPHSRWQATRYLAGDRHQEWDRDYGCLVLTSHGENKGNLFVLLPGHRAALDQLVTRLSPRSYRHLPAFFSALFGGPHASPDGQASVDVIAPYQVRFDPESLRWADGKLHGALLAGNHVATTMTELSAFPHHGDGQTQVPITCDKWTHEGEEFRREFTVDPVSDDLALTLRCGAPTVAHEDIEVPALGSHVPARVAYGLVDPDLSALAAALVPGDADPDPGRGKRTKKDGLNADAFASAAGRLFTLTGWQVDVIPRGKTSDFVDAMAFHPIQRICLAIECTLSAPTKDGKIQNLLVRKNAIADELTGFEVIPVVVVPIKAVLLGDVRRNLEEKGVTLLDASDLERLLDLVGRGCGPADSLGYLRDRGPQPPTAILPFGLRRG